MKVIFLKNFNGWGKGSVVRLVNEMAQDYISKGYCKIADESAQEFKQPIVEEAPVKESKEEKEPVTEGEKEETKKFKNK